MWNLQQLLLTVAATVSVVCVAHGLGDQAVVHDNRPIRIEVHEAARPVAEAVRQIERHFGRVVTYEDTSYVNADDILDVTEKVRRDGQMSQRVLVMRPGSIEFTYASRSKTVEGQLEDVLVEVFARSSRAGNSGDFRFEAAKGGGYHVVPVARTGASGATEVYASPLETRVTFMSQESSAFEVLLLLASELSARSGRLVQPGVMPVNLLARTRVTTEAHDDRARDVLWQLLQSVNPALSWQLFCAVGEAGACAINIHAVR